jgi:hypothetical protein
MLSDRRRQTSDTQTEKASGSVSQSESERQINLSWCHRLPRAAPTSSAAGTFETGSVTQCISGDIRIVSISRLVADLLFQTVAQLTQNSRLDDEAGDLNSSDNSNAYG